MRTQLPLFLCLTLSFPAAAFELRTDSQGDLVQWTRALEMVLDTRVAELLHEGQAEGAIRSAMQNLDDATPSLEVSLTLGEGKPMGYVAGAQNQNSILALEEWPYSEDALAVTLVTLNARTNELLDADVAFNVQEHHFRVLPEAARDERGQGFDDVQNTITHELGHVLGLMHSDASEDLVMYPSAPPGELIKRTLKTDDRDGLLTLYGAAPAGAADPQMGCSATSTPPSWMLIAGLLFALLRKGKAWALLAVVPGLALAAEPVPSAVTRAEEIALVEVSSRRCAQHPTNPGLIVTELTLAPVECLKGACGGLTSVVVPGGRLGDLEQIAVHEPVPAQGQRVLVTRTAGRIRVLQVEPQAQQQLIKTLRAQSGWTAPQGAGLPPLTTTQAPAITP